MNQYSLLILFSLTLLTDNLGSPQMAISYQEFKRLQKLQTDNYMGCQIWKDEICEKYEDIFEVDDQMQCKNIDQRKNGCVYYLDLGFCLQCKQNWKLVNVIIQNKTQSSLYCIPNKKYINFYEQKGCIKCKQAYIKQNGRCQMQGTQMISQLGFAGCEIILEGKCLMCQNQFYMSNRHGRCLKIQH